jgi:environmental stress-induced protein Ves
MSIVTIAADRVAPQAWRNGGGQTRELLAWPTPSDWALRISRADIGADGPFSEFAGVQRWFAVLHGAGVRLRFAHTVTTLQAGDAPLQFDGASAPLCELVGGPTQDLNLMVRGGRGVMQAVQEAAPWHAHCSMRGMYAVAAGVWSDGEQTQALPAHTLLWCETPADRPWTFSPRAAQTAPTANDAAHSGAYAPAIAFWLGFTPETPP